MLSILTLLSFWMKPDSGEKINLGLTILLAFSVFMLLIAESMPSTSFHVPIIGEFPINCRRKEMLPMKFEKSKNKKQE